MTTTYLEQTHYYRGEYERVVELATDNLAALPADWVHEHFGSIVPASVSRSPLAGPEPRRSSADSPRRPSTKPRRSGSPSRRSMRTPSAGPTSPRACSTSARATGRRRAHSIEHGIAVLRTGNVVVLLPLALATSAGCWRSSVRRAARWTDSGKASSSSSVTRRAESAPLPTTRWVAACLLLGRLDEARRLGARAVESAPGRPGFAAHALHLLGDIATHPDRFDAESGEVHYRQALALAEPRGMRPLVAHCHLGLGKLYRRTGNREQAQRAPHHRDDDVPRDGHAVLAGAGGGGDEGVGVSIAALIAILGQPRDRVVSLDRDSRARCLSTSAFRRGAALDSLIAHRYHPGTTWNR